MFFLKPFVERDCIIYGRSDGLPNDTIQKITSVRSSQGSDDYLLILLFQSLEVILSFCSNKPYFEQTIRS